MKLICEKIEKFYGLHEDDVDAWIEKLLSLAKAFKTPDGDIEQQMPAMLGGSAYEVWASLSEDGKKCQEKIFAQLRQSFGLPRFEAWRRLKNIKYEPGQNIEVVANSARRLLKICNNGQQISDEILGLFLIDAMPKELAYTVKVRLGNSAQLKDIIQIAKSSSAEDKNERPLRVAAVQMTRVQCYNCHQTGHIARFCQKPQVTNNSKIACGICKKFGHREENCWHNNSGNGSADSSAPAKSAMTIGRQSFQSRSTDNY